VFYGVTCHLLLLILLLIFVLIAHNGPSIFTFIVIVVLSIVHRVGHNSVETTWRSQILEEDGRKRQCVREDVVDETQKSSKN
jgi:hypothetical protein